MPQKLSSLIVGIVYTFFGIAGLFPGCMHLPPTRVLYEQMHIIGGFGYIFGWLPSNILHDILYLAIGGSGILAATTTFTATWFQRGVFGLCLMLAFAGLTPFGVDDVWGLLPLFSWNVMLHVVTVILTYYFGFIYPLDLGGPPAYRAVAPRG